MARYTRADVIVVGLIGERGREVKFYRKYSQPRRSRAFGGDHRPADVSRHCAECRAPPMPPASPKTFAIALDSMCADYGFADALCDGTACALAIGEPPATKRLSALSVHQSCRRWSSVPVWHLHGGGSITAFYTVLTEDDQQDPHCRLGTRNPRRAHCLVPPSGGGGALSGH